MAFLGLVAIATVLGGYSLVFRCDLKDDNIVYSTNMSTLVLDSKYRSIFLVYIIIMRSSYILGILFSVSSLIA